MTYYQIKLTNGGIIVFNADNLVEVVKEVNKILRAHTYHEDEIEIISEAYPAIEESDVLYRAMHNIYQYQMRTVFGLKAFSSAEEMLFEGQTKEVEEFLRAYIKTCESFDEAFVWEFVKKTLDEGGHA
jgi:ASC-1-like (ASCH) protein